LTWDNNPFEGEENSSYVRSHDSSFADFTFLAATGFHGSFHVSVLHRYGSDRSDPAFQDRRAEQTPEIIAAIRADLGLDQPLPVQYVKWLAHIVKGDWAIPLSARRRSE